METRNTKADAIEAAADGDWLVAAEIYRELGDVKSAQQCEEHAAREKSEREEKARKRAQVNQAIADFFAGKKP